MFCQIGTSFILTAEYIIFTISETCFTSLAIHIGLWIQNYWVFGLFPSSGILETIKHDV
jgi:hypothetical protein